MRRLGLGWAPLALVAVLVTGVGLYLTGRLELRWRAPAGDAHQHGEGEKKGDAHGEGEAESRVSGDKAILDAEAIKVAGIQVAPATTGSVAVTLPVTGEVRVPDQRLAQVTARIAGIVREIHRARGDVVSAGTPLLTLESADLADGRAAYAGATTDLRIAEERVDLWRRQKEAGFSVASAGVAGNWVELDQALAEQQAAQTDKTVAENAYGRMKELHDRGLRSRTELIAAEADLARAAARADAAARRLVVLGTVADTELARARQKLEASRGRLRAFGAEPIGGSLVNAAVPGGSNRFVVASPIPGVVADRQVTVGESVDPTSKVFAIADPSEVWVTVALYDKDVVAVRPGMPAVVRVQGLGDTTFRGEVLQLGTQVDEKTRTLPVRVLIKNQRAPGSKDGWVLRPGMFATVDLETSRKSAAVVVPLAAVQSVDGQDVVFVETALSEGAAFQRRPVKIGTRDEARVEVLEGLQAGERVVVANAYLLKSEFERSKIGQGHAH